ncbi:uncharacterized protein [Amphiura filiformis]|uniref:uncharacterized protein n=1 Tax=Amphiura filiformis TaxID=82378 RepID=UPI003B20F9AC
MPSNADMVRLGVPVNYASVKLMDCFAQTSVHAVGRNNYAPSHTEMMMFNKPSRTCNNFICKDNGLTPSSLKIRCPINTEKARNIIKRAEKELVNERIRVVSNKIKYLQGKRELQNNDLETLLVNNNTEHDSDVRRHIENHIVNKRQNEEKKTKERHIAKLDRLKKKEQAKFVDKKNTELDLSGTNLKKWRERWVKNLSEKDLTDPQESLLARGLGFAVSVNKIPHDEFIVACESACAKLPPGEAQNLRMEVAGSLKTAKIPPSNITKEERKAIKELQKSKDLLIMGADKGKCTAVQTIQNYESKVETMLSDTKTYEKLKKDPTPTYKRKLVGMLQKLKAEKKIEEGQYRLLYPTAENTPRLYCTTKIHKQGDPIRQLWIT